MIWPIDENTRKPKEYYRFYDQYLMSEKLHNLFTLFFRVIWQGNQLIQ